MSRNDVAAFVLAMVGLAAMALTGLCQPKRAQAGPATVLYVADLNAPAIEVPEAFAQESGPVFWCESKFNPEAVGAAGERGFGQIHPVHFPRMRAQGLSPDSNRDLVQYAAWLWERSGWGPWSCRP